MKRARTRTRSGGILHPFIVFLIILFVFLFDVYPSPRLQAVAGYRDEIAWQGTAIRMIKCCSY